MGLKSDKTKVYNLFVKNEIVEDLHDNSILTRDEKLKGDETKVTISNFKGKKTINLRKYFNSQGDWKPTKKGINLSINIFLYKII